MNEKQMLEMATRIQGWMKPGELSWLFNLARTLPEGATWVEIGVWKGRSYTAPALGLPAGSTLIGVDTFEGSEGRKATSCREATLPGDPVFKAFLAHQEKLSGMRPDLTLSHLRGDSPSVASRVEDASVTVVFVDGDHRYEPFMEDLKAWSPKVKPDGILIGHDHFNKDIRRALVDSGIAARRVAGNIWQRRG